MWTPVVLLAVLSTVSAASRPTIVTKRPPIATQAPTGGARCYTDSVNPRTMSGPSTSSGNMTPAQCAAYCTDVGYEYSGTEYGNTCYCSHTMPSFSSSGCTTRCVGDSSQYCGGNGALSVVYTAPSTVKTTSAKRGLCWPYNNPASSFALFNANQIPWLYNWEMYDPRQNGNYAGAQYVALFRGPDRQDQVSWYFNANSRVSSILLGFNEPDLPGNEALTPAQAAASWRTYLKPLPGQYGTTLGAPAVTNSQQSGQGISWLQQFISTCPDCTFSFIPVHWYGYSFSQFQQYITLFHNTFPNYNLWVTEFAFTDHDQQSTANLAKLAIQWLDQQSYVTRYAMFGPMNAANMAGITGSAMVTDDLSALTSVGQVYTGQL